MEANQTSGESKTETSEQPAPETLRPQEESEQPDAASGQGASKDKPVEIHKPRRNAYRPSHKAAFVGIAVVIAILGINAAVIGYLLKRQSGEQAQSQVAAINVNQGVLDKLGVNRSAIGDKGIELIVNPNARFNGKMQVGGDVSVAGELKLSRKFSAGEASLANLQAGNTQLQQVNVNGDGTMSGLTLRQNLNVAGSTRLQGDVTLTRLLTVNNSANVAGNLAVGGTLSAGNLQIRSLTVTSGVTLGGHIVSGGPMPAVRAGNALGSNGTVSISGNDTAGTVAANIGVGAVAGQVASVSFVTPYGTIPRVVVSPIGVATGAYVTRTATGFTINVTSAMPPGGFAFDYIVMQ